MPSKLIKKQGATVAPAVHIPAYEEARGRLFGPVDEEEMTDERVLEEERRGVTLERAQAEGERFLKALVARSRAQREK